MIVPKKPIVPPRVLNFYLTDECNLECKHCFIENSKKHAAENNLSTEEFCQAIDDLSDMVYTIRLSGAEPLLQFDKVIAITKYATSLGKRVFLLTNTVLLDEKKIKVLKEAGLTGIQVPCEGIGDVQDEIRGKGYYENLLWKLMLIGKSNIPCFMVFTLTPTNCFQVIEIYKIAKKLNIRRIVFSPVLAVKPSAEYLKIPFVQFIEAIKELINTIKYKECISLPDIGFSPESYIFASKDRRLWETFPEAIRSSLRRLQLCRERGRFFVFPNGNVYSCPFFPYLNPSVSPIGNIRQQSVRELYTHLSEICKISCESRRDPQCIKCKFFKFCHGGCPVRVYVSSGSLDGVHKDCPTREK